MRNLVRVFLLFLLSTQILCAEGARNVILLIGDGFGPALFGATHLHHKHLSKKKLNLEKLMNAGTVGLLNTESSAQIVTDSAAGATAFACGVKTYNEGIGVDARGRPVRTILEMAQERKKSVGLVTTAELSDATPAAFSAHSTRRAEKEEIASQQLAKMVDVLLGGGGQNFKPAYARNQGYRIVKTAKELKEAGTSERLLGVFADDAMSYVAERSVDEPTLTNMTERALAILSKNEKGFFLMVEGGRIDHAAHANEPEKMLREALEFDEAIGLCVKFASVHPDTLILVTADHDTGGFTFSKQSGDYPSAEVLKTWENVFWISHNHTAIPVFLIGYGPGAKEVSGFHENTHVFEVMKKAYGF